MSKTAVILYIEDNLHNRKLVTRLFEAYGYEVHTAVNGFEGLDFVQHQTPDLVLMDLNMPAMDGYTVTQKMRDMPHMAQVPIIALTANVMKGNRERSLDAGCDGYIPKPISVDTFPNQLEAFLERGRVLFDPDETSLT